MRGAQRHRTGGLSNTGDDCLSWQLCRGQRFQYLTHGVASGTQNQCQCLAKFCRHEAIVSRIVDGRERVVKTKAP